MLDTNVLVSALLFEQGRLSWLRHGWQQGLITPVLAKPTAKELMRVLAYPKFRLQLGDRERLLEDLLPWCESWAAAIPTSKHRVRDPHDQEFLDLALAAATPVLVSGDADLLARKQEVVPLQIINPADFQSWLATGSIHVFMGLLAGRSARRASLEELNEAAASGWAGLQASSLPATNQ